jgi:uncharacterized protein (DUF608 family)
MIKNTLFHPANGVNLILIFVFLFFFILPSAMAQRFREWPVLKRYEQSKTDRIAMPVGGIGTGTVSLSGRGALVDWEIVNRPAIGFKPSPSFAVLFAQAAGEPPVTRLLEGTIENHHYIGNQGATADVPGLPRFAKHSFAAAYPFGQVNLSDEAVPLEITLQAYNPLIPGDVNASSIPVAVLRYLLVNKTEKSVKASVCASLQNFIGTDGLYGKMSKNTNTFRKGNGVQGIWMQTEGTASCDERYGTIALTTPVANKVSYRTSWPETTLWFNTHILDFWKDFSEDGHLDDSKNTQTQDSPVGSLAVELTVLPRDSATVEFFLTWHFPNRQRMSWKPEPYPADCDPAHRVGNYYTTQYTDAWQVAEKTMAALPDLEQRTVDFVKAFCQSPLPVAVKEAALFNVTNLRSQTAFRAEDGRLFGYEGTLEQYASWPGNCTHVWNYEQVVPFLFGELSKTMREVEYAFATDENGLMSFRVTQPLTKAAEYKQAAADGQMGSLMKLYRDWQLSGDNNMLQRLWPKARKSLEFAWQSGGWDADADGVMEGCQHNTMDVEYFGPNPQMQGWYLGALKATARMAGYMGDRAFAQKCMKLYENGRQWTEKYLFNGEYYIQQVRPPQNYSQVRPELILHKKIYHSPYPNYQLEKGCLVDQLVGQYMAHICGLGYLLDSAQVRQTLRSIMTYNFKPMQGHFNNMRSYALHGEAGLLMATYPKGTDMEFPFPYFNEVMTGFEYSTAAHMVYENMEKDALRCIEAIRDRFDGNKRNPFNKIEAGYHYARSMAAWAVVLAYTGFSYSAVDHSLMLGDVSGTHTWTNGYGWGTFTVVTSPGSKQKRVEVTVRSGSLTVQHLTLKAAGSLHLKKPVRIEAGKSYLFKVDEQVK